MKLNIQIKRSCFGNIKSFSIKYKFSTSGECSSANETRYIDELHIKFLSLLLLSFYIQWNHSANDKLCLGTVKSMVISAIILFWSTTFSSLIIFDGNILLNIEDKCHEVWNEGCQTILSVKSLSQTNKWSLK